MSSIPRSRILNIHCTAAMTLVLCMSMPARGAVVIVSWDFSGDPGNQPTEPATSSASGIIGNPITRGAGLGAVAAMNSFNSNNWDDQIDEFIEFGFTVAPGNIVDLENLIIATRSSPTGPGTVGLFTSLDAFATAIHTFNQGPGDNFVNTVVDLTSLPSIPSGPFSARLIEIGNTQADGVGDTSNNGTFRVADFLDTTTGSSLDVQFAGTVTAQATAPELSAFAIWAILAAGVCVCWRRLNSLV